jgi:hypothetical protein
MNWLGKQLGMKSFEDWYSFSASDLQKVKTHSSLLKVYGNSIYRTLCAVYPEYKWDPLQFNKVPPRYWQDINHERQFLDGILVIKLL